MKLANFIMYVCNSFFFLRVKRERVIIVELRVIYKFYYETLGEESVLLEQICNHALKN